MDVESFSWRLNKRIRALFEPRSRWQRFGDCIRRVSRDPLLSISETDVDRFVAVFAANEELLQLFSALIAPRHCDGWTRHMRFMLRAVTEYRKLQSALEGIVFDQSFTSAERDTWRLRLECAKDITAMLRTGLLDDVHRQVIDDADSASIDGPAILGLQCAFCCDEALWSDFTKLVCSRRDTDTTAKGGA